jgi:hypothetical protein
MSASFTASLSKHHQITHSITETRLGMFPGADFASVGLDAAVVATDNFSGILQLTAYLK